MKKLLFLSLMLTTAMTVSAQMQVAPKMEKGMVKVYGAESVTSVPGQKDVKMTTEMRYTVMEATADGYVVDVVTTEFSTDADPSDLAGQLISMNAAMFKDVAIRVATDKNGKALRILNYAELDPVLNGAADKIIDKLFEATPQLAQMVSKDALKQQMATQMTEDAVLRSVQSASSVMTLNGKTVMTGAQEEYVNEQGMNMKRMFFVNGNSIVANAVLNMSNDELKALIIAQVEKSLPDQAELVKENIDQLMTSGMLKMDMKETATYVLQDDGWVKTLTYDSTVDTMGQSATNHLLISCK